MPSWWRGEHRVPVLLFLLTASIYALSGNARIANSDAMAMYQVGQSLRDRQRFDRPCVPLRREGYLGDPQCVPGIDGKHYTGYGPVSSLLLVPALTLGPPVGRLLSIDREVASQALASLSNAPLTALAPVVLYLWLLRLGEPIRAALPVALLLAFATPLWFFGAKSYHSEPQLAVALLGSALFLARPSGFRSGVLAGACLGLACGIRAMALVLVPAFGWYGLRKLRDADPGRARAHAAGALAALSTCLVLLGWLNAARFGSPFLTGYHTVFPTLSSLLATPLLTGLGGLLLDREVGLVWYHPVLLVALLAFRPFARRHPDEAWLAAGVSVISLLFLAKYTFWHGGWSYGPRLLAPCLPFLVVPAAGLSESRLGVRRMAGVVVSVALVVQVLGLTSSVYRYYYLEAFGRSRAGQEAGYARPWWNGDARWLYPAALFQNVDALPALLGLRPSSAAERYLASLPDPIDQTRLDVWWVKPRLVRGATVAGAAALVVLAGWTGAELSGACRRRRATASG